MKVLKFGGTSVGSVDSILSVKKIVEACNRRSIRLRRDHGQTAEDSLDGDERRRSL